MVTMGTLLADARTRLDEATARQWTDPQIRSWVNEAAKDIARKTETLQDRQTIAAVIGTSEYSLATNCIRVHRVEFKQTAGAQTRELSYVDVRSLDQVGWTDRSHTDSQPFYYTIWGSGTTLKLVTFPAPSVAGNFTVYYYRLPVELVEVDGSQDGSTVEIPEAWNDIALDYIEYRALRRDRDPRWVEAKGIYDENLATMYDNTRRWADESGMIVPNVSPLPTWLYAMED